MRLKFHDVERSLIRRDDRDGNYGLYVDSSFSDGLSERCETFGNDVLCQDVDVNGRGRFECMVLEVWHIGV